MCPATGDSRASVCYSSSASSQPSGWSSHVQSSGYKDLQRLNQPLGAAFAFQPWRKMRAREDVELRWSVLRGGKPGRMALIECITHTHYLCLSMGHVFAYKTRISLGGKEPSKVEAMQDQIDCLVSVLLAPIPLGVIVWTVSCGLLAILWSSAEVIQRYMLGMFLYFSIILKPQEPR